MVIVAGNGLSRGAKLRSGRAGHRIRRARQFRDEGAEKRARQRATLSVLATPGIRRPGLPVRPALTGEPRREVGANGERGREHLGSCRAVGWVEREPARKQEARESGYGSSRRESSEGRLQGRERHETRPRSVGAPRRTTGSERGSCVPRARPEPSRGARTLRTAPVGAWRPPPYLLRPQGWGGPNGAPGVEVLAGARTPREANPELGQARGEGASHRRETGARAAETRFGSEGDANSRRGTSGTSVLGVKSDEENPEAARTARGARRKPTRRYSVDSRNL